MSYEFRVCNTKGDFEITNKGRDKVVFTGSDERLESKANDTYKFDSVRDMMSEIATWISFKTLRQISKKLAAW